MSDPCPPIPRSPTDAEAAEFRALGLTPGHWAALAPVPVLLHDHVHRGLRHSLRTLHSLRDGLSGHGFSAPEAEQFWSRYADQSIGPDAPAIARALLAWYLSHLLPQDESEKYLMALDRVAEESRVLTLPWPHRTTVADEVRRLVELYLPLTEYTRNPTQLCVTAPAPPVVVTTPATPSPAGAQRAKPFTTVTFHEAMARARSVSVVRIRDWLANPENANRQLFDNHRSDCPEVAVVREPAVVPKSLWIVGDVHADVLTLANIIAHAERVGREEGEPPAFLFLGDFVDRGRHDHETLLLLFGLILKDPARVCVIPGNHDVDLRWGEKAGQFGVTIEPAEYCERLNGLLGSEDPADREQLELARLSIEFWKTRPKAVFLPDGTMFAHGGFPHTDLHDSLKTVADLGAKKCLDDFLWARLSESRKKRPNRSNRGHEFGWNDFAQFCRVMTETVGVTVRRLVRGHDHVPARWQLPPDYAEYPVLTLNAMGWRMDGEPEPAEGPHPFPAMARHVPDSLPRVVQLPLDPAQVERGLAKENPNEIDDSELPLSGVRVDPPPSEPRG